MTSYIIPGLAPPLEVIADYFDTSTELMRSRSRERNVTDARHVAMWYYRKRGLSLKRIGENFNRSHCTVLNAIANVENIITTDKHFRRIVQDVENICNGRV